MAEDPKGREQSRTLVCSVLFIDIAGYSQLGVSDQIKLKQKFNDILAGSLLDLEARDRVVIDTGDGAAIAFLDDPERALFAAIAANSTCGQTAPLQPNAPPTNGQITCTLSASIPNDAATMCCTPFTNCVAS